MRIFQEEEYEQPSVDRDGYGRDDSEGTGLDAKIHEKLVKKPKLPEMKVMKPLAQDLGSALRSGDWGLLASPSRSI